MKLKRGYDCFSVFREGKYKGGGTSKLKDSIRRRTCGLFIYTPQKGVDGEKGGRETE